MHDRISNELAFELAKLVGNVPLALQVIGRLFNDDGLYDIDEILLAMNRDIIDATSPDELLNKERMITTLNVSYQYLPRAVQSCAHILSYIPGPFTLKLAHFVLSDSESMTIVTEIMRETTYDQLIKIENILLGVNNYSHTSNDVIYLGWEHTNTTRCLALLVRRSLLSKHNGRYKFHQLVKEFFQHVQKKRSNKIASVVSKIYKNPTSIIKSFNSVYHLVMSQLNRYCSVWQFYSREYHNGHEFHSPQHLAAAGRYYISAHENFPNCKTALSCQIGIIYTGQLDYILKYNVSYLMYMKKYSPDFFIGKLVQLYEHIPILESIDHEQSNYTQERSSLGYFSKYVRLLIMLARMETLKFNSSYALKHLLLKSEKVNSLYNLTCKDTRATECHKIHANYYAALATKYRQLNKFDNFMEYWQKVLRLRTLKCKQHRCSKLQIGQAEFSKGEYELAISYIKPHLYSHRIPAHKRARLFAIVLYSYIQLGHQETAEQLIHTDVEPVLSIRKIDAEIIDSEHISQCIIYRPLMLPHPPTITQELYHIKLHCNLHRWISKQDCRECRTLMIFSHLIRKYFKTYDTVGFLLRKKVTQYVYSLITSDKYHPRPPSIWL